MKSYNNIYILIFFSVLDEATSQIGIDMENYLYRLCEQHQITVISIGHRDTLRQFHHLELHINAEDCSWTLMNLESKA